ncbi:MAG: alpha-hydroxy-acid oxidizing protein [Alphaproteobacteria bacterium]|jgi:4-hydroxymandelate oxidase|nr:alpha-hydroxy-acid oxidizing protein [Alphaproteobacteria bacterium]MBT5389274.1 alpha-hydroxy-acid oxidizing protein [Alphaproteobacteria bacterium]
MKNDFIDLYDIEEKALQAMPENIKSFIYGGAGKELSLQRNLKIFDSILLKPRVLRDIRTIDLHIKVGNTPLNSPILIAPMAFQGLLHHDAEIATAKAASSQRVCFIPSMLSSSPMENIIKKTESPLWFQSYIYQDKEITKTLIQKAESVGYKAIVLTVDAPIYGKRKSESLHPLILKKESLPKNLIDLGILPSNISPEKIAGFLSSLLEPAISWKNIEWIKSITKLPIILKGIMSAKDAKIALKHKISTIIISNHGGRQLDTTRTSIEVLPEILRHTENRIEVLVDGGIRSGSDIFKAIALGAKAVLIGRPVLSGLLMDGEKGVASVLNILHKELEATMHLCGCKSISEITEDHVTQPHTK